MFEDRYDVLLLKTKSPWDTVEIESGCLRIVLHDLAYKHHFGQEDVNLNN